MTRPRLNAQPRPAGRLLRRLAGFWFSVMAVVGPPVVTLLCVEMGETGWLGLAGLMLAIALVSVPASRWALA